VILVATENASQKPKWSHNACPNSQLHTEKWDGHCASFVAMLCSLHSITDEYQCKKLLCNESRPLQKKAWQSQWEATPCYRKSCYRKSTPCVVSEKNRNSKVAPWYLLCSCCSCRKRHISGQSNVKQWRNQACM